VAWWGESRGAVPPAEGRNAGQPAKESEQTMKSMLSAAVVVGAGITGSAMGQGGNVIAPEFAFALSGTNEGGHSDVFGDLAVLGDLTYSGGGAARVFIRGSGGWAAGPILTPPGARVQFGSAVQVSADWVVVGDQKRDSARGVVHVWKRVGNALAFHQTLMAPDGVGNDWFGHTASLNGTELFVTARLDDSWRGAIYRFGLNAAGQWEHRQKIQSPNTNASDEFGWEIQAAGDLLVASAWLSECGYSSVSGSAHVFKRGTDGNYTQVFWTPDNLPGCTGFAYTVGLWAGTACVGSGESSPPRTTLFTSVGGSWTMANQLFNKVAVIHSESLWALLYDTGVSPPVVRLYEGTPSSYLSNRVLSIPQGFGIDIFGSGDAQRMTSGYGGLLIYNLAQPDCDSDGTPDAAAIAQGAPDVNANGIPDTCDCLADVDESGAVNAVDLAAVLGVWGTSGGKYPRADIDGSGLVDAQDLAAVLGGWGSCP
jgi:hypothetical protein